MASLDDLVTVGNNLNKNISLLIQTITAVFPRISGTFTLAAASTTSVSQSAMQSNSIVLWNPVNSSAATLEGSAKNIYVLSKTSGTGFVVSTANGSAAAGTEQFSYVVINPS